MKKCRALVYLYCAVLAWVIADIYLMEVKKRGELVALCAGFGSNVKAPELSKADPAAYAAIEWISSAAGVAPNFTLFEGDEVPTIAFAGIKDGQRVIVYDAKAFDWSDRTARWRDVVVMAHEIGHHLGGHIATPLGDSHARELEADQFSGYAVSLLGGTLAQALSFTLLFPESDSESHPARERRREAITRGWMKGEAIKKGSLL